jgi:hypothetical protein
MECGGHDDHEKDYELTYRESTGGSAHDHEAGDESQMFSKLLQERGDYAGRRLKLLQARSFAPLCDRHC